MSVDQLKLIAVMRDAVNGAEERYPGYHKDLFDYVSQIVMLEREHTQRTTQIQKNVTGRVAALGVLIDRSAVAQ